MFLNVNVGRKTLFQMRRTRFNKTPNPAPPLWIQMDSEQRIQDLEQQVRELTRVVRDLSESVERQGAETNERDAEARIAPRASGKARRAKQRPPRPKRGNLKANVAKYLGGEAGDSLETRVGGIWLVRVAVVMTMTAAILGARLTIYSETMTPAMKLAVLYAVSAAAIFYGLFLRDNRNFFPQTVLGSGLAGVYFTTYSAFFMEGMRVSTDHRFALPILLFCLAVITIVCHVRKSQTVTGIALFLVYYTVIVSCLGGKSAENMFYALFTCAAMSLIALAFHAMHRWLLFSWGALIATHLTYLYFFLSKPFGLEMSDHDYFWLSNGFLTLFYFSFAFAGIVDARKTGEYRRGVAQMAGVNSFIYLVLMWIAVRRNYVEWEWAFRLGITAELLFMAVFAGFTGPRKNYLCQIYAAKSIVMFTLALQAYFSGATLMVAMSVECLGLAFSYQRSGVVMFKGMELGLLLIAFLGSVVHVKAAGEIQTGVITLPMNWFCCAGSSIAFMIVSWFYRHFVRRIKPEDRIVGSQWALADSFIDIRSSTAAMLHAAAAALILLCVTIIDQGDNPLLPYFLAGEGVLMTLAGFATRTPQIEVGGVLLIVAAHVCHHAFLIFGMPGFEIQPYYILDTVLLASVTYLGAYFWERYLRHAKGGRPWEHNFVAALPYLAATYMLTTLIGRQYSGIHVALAQNTIGVVLLLVGVLTRYTGVKASGVLAFIIGGMTMCNGLFIFHDAFQNEPDFPLYFSIYLLTFVLSERLFIVLQRQESLPSKGEDLLRSLLAATFAAFGLLGFTVYMSPEYATPAWLALAATTVLLGVIFRESRYRWISMALFAASVGRAFAYDLRKLPLEYQFLSFAMLGILLLIISWGYSRYRKKLLQPKKEERENDASHQEG
jgi:membrane protein implicated in regulation of membrane protease activity/uncharacterized membrane protein